MCYFVKGCGAQSVQSWAEIETWGSKLASFSSSNMSCLVSHPTFLLFNLHCIVGHSLPLHYVGSVPEYTIVVLKHESTVSANKGCTSLLCQLTAQFQHHCSTWTEKRTKFFATRWLFSLSLPLLKKHQCFLSMVAVCCSLWLGSFLKVNSSNSIYNYQVFPRGCYFCRKHNSRGFLYRCSEFSIALHFIVS